MSPIADVKAHDKEIIGLELVPVAEDPERTRVVLFSAGGWHARHQHKGAECMHACMSGSLSPIGDDE